jgi:hypothetical protein
MMDGSSTEDPRAAVIDRAEPVQLDLDVPPAVADAAAALCDLKVLMDQQSRGYAGQPFINDWMGYPNTCAFHGDSFLRLVIPFVHWTETDDRSRPRFRAYVDPGHVLGASIKGGPEQVRDDVVDSRIARYARDFEGGGHNRAKYDWFQPLGLLCAHEGKHRVAFMRAHAQPAIAAWVTPRSYPAAERIVLIAPTEPRDRWLALLDGRHLQVVLRPHVTQMVLTAYGVKVVRWRDLPEAPTEQYVRREIDARGLSLPPASRREADRSLDLHVLRAEEARANESVTRSAMNLAQHGWRASWAALDAGAIAATLMGAVLFQFDSLFFQRVGLVGIGLGLGLSMVPVTLRFTGTRGRS